MGLLTTLARLSSEERRAAREAAAELIRARVLVAAVAPRRWWREPPPAPTRQPPSSAAAVREVRDAVNRAQRRLPVTMKCLPQALAAQRMLARRGIAATLTLGTARDNVPGTDRFHAWCKVGDAWVTGDCDESAYAVLAPPRA